jgi:hypothetical protein
VPNSYRSTSRLALALAAIAVSAVSLAARQGAAAPPLPSGAEVIAKFITAIGGADAYKAVSFVHARGTFEMPAQNITGDFELFGARPAQALVRITIGPIGRAESGFNGEVGWLIDPMSGPSLMKGRMLVEMKNDSQFDGALHLPGFVKDSTTVAREGFDGHPAYKLKVTFASGQEQFEYYDVETGLQIGKEGSRETPMGELSATTIYRDYKKAGRLMQAMTQIERTMGVEQVLHVTSFDYDALPKDTFEPPPAIKALIK